MIWLKRALLALVAIILIAVAGVAIFLATFDPNAYKDDLIAAVEQRTGRSLRLDGNVELSLYPWLGLTADGIELGNAEGFGPEPFLKAGRIAVRTRLLPLIWRRLEMDTVRLEGAVINLAIDEQGRSNWADLAGAPAAAGGTPEATAPMPVAEDEPGSQGGMPLAALAIGGVDISNLSFTFDDRQQGSRLALTDFNASTGALSLGEPVPFKAAGHIEANQPALSGDFSLESTLVYDLSAERFELRPLTFVADLTGKQLPDGKARLEALANVVIADGGQHLELNGVKLSGLSHEATAEVKADLRNGDAPAVNAQVHASGPDLAILFRAFADPELAADLARLPDRAFAADVVADVDPAAGRFDVPTLSVKVLGTTVDGKASQSGDAVNASLRAAGPDLPALLRAVGSAGLAGEAPLAAVGAALAKHGAPKAFSIDSEITAKISGAALALPRFEADVLGAKVSASGLSVAGLDKGGMALSGPISAEGKDVSNLLAAAGALSGDKDDPLAQAAASLKAGGDSPFRVKAGIDLDPAKGRFGLDGLDAALLGITASGNVKGSGDALEGAIKVVGDKPARLLTAFGQADLARRLERFELSLPVKGEGSRMQLTPLSLSARLAGPELKQGPVDLAASSAITADTAAGDYRLEDISLTGLGMNVKGRVDASGVGEGALGVRKLDASLDVPVFNLRQVLTTLGQQLPEMADGKALTAVGLKASAQTAGESAKVSGLALSLDGANITGNLDVRSLEGPDATFRLAADTLDLDRYLPPGQKTAATPEAAAAGAATELPVELLRGLALDGEVKVGKLKMSGLTLNDILLTVKAAKGKITAAPLAAKLYEGSYQGSVGIDATGEVPALAISSKLVGIQAEPLLNDLSGKSRLRGRGDVTMDLTARGATDQALTRSLTGDIRMDFRDGAIKGVNIGKLMRQLESGSFSGVPSESTDFAELGGTVKCNQGVCNNDDLSLKSPLLRITGEGTVVNLTNDTIDYTLKTVLVDTAAGQGGKDLSMLKGVTIPIRVKGPTSDPKYAIDFGSLLKQKAEEEVKKQIGKKLGIDLLGGAAGGEAAPAEAPADGAAAPAAPATPEEAAKEAIKGGLKKLLKF
jgi:AsmA protein